MGQAIKKTISTNETKAVAAAFSSVVTPGIVTLRGDLGAGKTTFVQGLLSALGADGPFPSPTFILMKEYRLKSKTPSGISRVYHVDAYRIDDPEDILEIGFEEWVSDPEGLVLIEWPEKLGTLIPSSANEITFRWLSDTEREITLEK